MEEQSLACAFVDAAVCSEEFWRFRHLSMHQMTYRILKQMYR